MPKQYRIAKLDGCDVWRIEVLTTTRWPFRLWIDPRWLPTREFSIFALDCPPRPVERRSEMDAVETLESFERRDREAAAREAGAWSPRRLAGLTGNLGNIGQNDQSVQAGHARGTEG